MAMLSVGLVVVGGYGIFRSAIALQNVQEKKKRVKIYKYLEDVDFQKYIRPEDSSSSFILHLPANEISKDTAVGILRISIPKFQINLSPTNKRTEVNLNSNDFQSNAVIPLTSSFSLEMKNQWSEVYSTTFNFNLKKPNIIIPLVGFRPIFDSSECLEMTLSGNPQTMQDEYKKIANEELNFYNFSTSSILMKKTVLDHKLHGLYLYGKLQEQDKDSQYQNVMSTSPNGHSDPNAGRKTNFVASHGAVSKDRLVDGVFEDEEAVTSVLLGVSVGTFLLGPIVYLLK